MYSADVNATSIFPHSHLFLPFICNNVLNEEGEICECWYESRVSDVVKSHDGTRGYRAQTSLGCPFCSKIGVHSDLRNSFGVIYPDQSQPGVWLQEQNDKTPFEVAKGSRYLAWFHCLTATSPSSGLANKSADTTLAAYGARLRGSTSIALAASTLLNFAGQGATGTIRSLIRNDSTKLALPGIGTPKRGWVNSCALFGCTREKTHGWGRAASYTSFVAPPDHSTTPT